MEKNDELDRLLEFDPLAEAETITGKSYKDDELTGWLGVGLGINQNRLKAEALRERGDTTMGDSIERYVSIIEGAGFEQALALSFMGTGYGEGECEEVFYVYARKDGLLLAFDTFGGSKVNSSNLYYNVRLDDERDWIKVVSTGHLSEGVLVGNHDGREALLRKIERLTDAGEVLPQWIERPFLWLLHYMDTKSEGYDYRAINAERIAMLPEWVRAMIGEAAP